MAAPPFQISSVSVPLIGVTYLDERPGLIPLPAFADAIAATGANAVKISVASVLKYGTDNDYDDALTAQFNPALDKIAAFAALLQERGIAVELQAQALIANATDQNNIIADRIMPSDPVAWMGHHTEEMVKWATFAEEIGAVRFSLFTDLEQHMTYGFDPASPITRGWIDLAAAIRTVFSGHLTAMAYTDGTVFPGGNDHTRLTPKAIWDAVDSIGLGFFPEPLTERDDPSPDELVAAWYADARGFRPVDYLRSLAAYYGKPVYINDRTFHSFDGANRDHVRIFDGSIPLVVDEQEQADLYESFLRVLSLEQGDWLLGVSFNSFSRFVPGSQPGVARFLFSPYGENVQGKAAEQVLSAWYGGDRQGDGLALVGGAAADRLAGGYHHDQIAGLDGADTLTGGDGHDLLDGGGGADRLAGGPGEDTVYGLDGPDSVDGDDGADQVNGNKGDDQVRGGEGDDTVRGGQDGDTVDGGGGEDWVNGELGDDLVFGGTGADQVRGGQGDDRVFGGDGDDAVMGDRGHDTLGGGAGADAFVFFADNGHDLVEDFDPAADVLSFHVPGGTFNGLPFAGFAAILALSADVDSDGDGAADAMRIGFGAAHSVTVRGLRTATAAADDFVLFA
ncbi:hypothetical protein [Stella sp.]|uniref:hypothetical protein n=1 Tax=Stella sp. TaxID=2912054 RepID=UPI0035B1DE7B